MYTAFVDTTPYQDGALYCIARDGEHRAYTRDPLAWFHRQHPYSMGHALQHEGYSIERICD